MIKTNPERSRDGRSRADRPPESLAPNRPANPQKARLGRRLGPSTQSLILALVVLLSMPFAYHFGWKFLGGAAVDYPSVHYAANLAFNEEKSPYGSSAFDQATMELGRKVHPYFYPPPSLLAFWPLAKMEFRTGHAALLLASHLAYLSAIWLILARLTPLPNDQLRRVLLLVCSLAYFFSFDPSMVTLAIGQINLIVLAFVCWAILGMRRNGPAWQIALPLSIAILLKTYPILLLAPLVFHRRFQAVLLTCLFFGGFTAFAAAVLPAEVWAGWFREVMPQGGYANNAIAAAAHWNQNINGFVSRLFLPNEFSDAPLAFAVLAKPLATLLALAVVAITALSSFQAGRASAADRSVTPTETASYLLMIFLVAPLSWEHHLVYVLPAAVLGICLLLERALSGKEAFVILAALCLMAWPVPIADPALKHGWWTLLISAKFYAVAALWVFFVRRLCPGRSRPWPERLGAQAEIEDQPIERKLPDRSREVGSRRKPRWSLH